MNQRAHKQTQTECKEPSINAGGMSLSDIPPLFFIEIFKNFSEDCADFSSENIEKQRNTPKKSLDLQKWSKVIIVNHRAWNEKAHAGIA